VSNPVLRMSGMGRADVTYGKLCQPGGGHPTSGLLAEQSLERLGQTSGVGHERTLETGIKVAA